MSDNLTKSQRKYNMSRIKRKNTKPEVFLRSELFRRWIKWYRVDYNIKWRPDIVFTKYKVAIFIDWCFWHKCPECYKEPKTNQNYWMPKIERNVERDIENTKYLENQWRKVLRFREHEIKNSLEEVIKKIKFELKSKSKKS